MEEQNGLAAAIKGRVEGVAVVRDKYGNIKGSFTFGGEATKEQFDELKKSTLGDSHGSDTSHGGA